MITPVWKQQKLNNACAANVLCMMLSCYEIDFEIVDFVKACNIHLMIDYDSKEKTFDCGFLAYQTAENYNNALAQYQLELTEMMVFDIEQFFFEARQLSKNQIPFMLSLPVYLLPYHDPTQQSQRKHALLVIKADHEKLIVLDSDAGLDRSQNYAFETVKNQVMYPVFFKDIRQLKQINYGFLSPLTAGALFFSKQRIIRNSINYVQVWKSMSKESLLNLSTGYESFYQFTWQFIRPFANDFYTALKCTHPTHSLLPDLELIKNKSFDFLKQVKQTDNPPLKEIIAFYRIHCSLLAEKITDYLESSNR
ncbi:MAG TPA: hypothetical protein PKJ08_03980 [Candidatus Cloacimonadota bacterium]|jgi:hypothetical protein|nr:hypothetical protein [Candidatus Cloacimonadota bacterium]